MAGFFFKSLQFLGVFFSTFFGGNVTWRVFHSLSLIPRKSRSLFGPCVVDVVSFMDGPLKQILKPIRKKAPDEKVLPESESERGHKLLRRGAQNVT